MDGPGRSRGPEGPSSGSHEPSAWDDFKLVCLSTGVRVGPGSEEVAVGSSAVRLGLAGTEADPGREHELHDAVERVLREGDGNRGENAVRQLAARWAASAVGLEHRFGAVNALQRRLTTAVVRAYREDPVRLVGALDSLHEFANATLLTISREDREQSDTELTEQRQIAEKRAAETAASQASQRSSEARFSRLYDSGILGILVCDLLGNIKEANDCFLGMVGYSREELVSGQVRWSEMTPPAWKDIDDDAV